MEIQVREHIIRFHIIEIKGRLEAFTVAELRKQQDQLLEQGALRLIVDLKNVEFMDSAGMSALVALLKRVRQAGGDLVLIKPTDPAANRILTLTRFDRVFTLVDSVDEALKKF